MKNIALLLVLSFVPAACGPPARPDTGGQAIAVSSNKSAIYVADTDQGAVVRLDVASGTIDAVPVGGEPTRIARAGDRLFVSLRAERAVAVLIEQGRSLQVEARLPTGAEPFGVVASADGSKVWVAASLADRVEEIDVASLTITRSFAIPGEPRWMTLDGEDRSLFVACVRDPAIKRIDLESGAVTSIALPQILSSLRPRITGDPAITPDGGKLLIPVLYVESVGAAGAVGPGWGGSASTFLEIPGRINPVLVVAEVDDDGELDGEMEVVNVGAFNPDPNSLGIAAALNGYPASVTVAPDSSFAAVSVEGSGEVVIAPLIDIQGRTDGKFSVRGGFVVQAGAGARAAAFTENRVLWTYSFLDRKVGKLELGDAPDQLRQFNLTAGVESLVRASFAELAPSSLPPDVERGRRLFYATNDGYMQIKGGRLSCATCHFDGRDDGLTWDVPELGRRQTPSLAGPVSMTAPVRWEGDRISVADDAQQTSVGLMGGVLTTEDAQAIQAFVDWTRDADVPAKGTAEVDAQLERGRAIFERPDVGCANCHHGPRYTDNSLYSMFGMSSVKTRSLVGVAATAPYLHDGSAPTLRAVLDMAAGAGMGNASHLSELELTDLEAYLRSL